MKSFLWLGDNPLGIAASTQDVRAAPAIVEPLADARVQGAALTFDARPHAWAGSDDGFAPDGIRALRPTEAPLAAPLPTFSNDQIANYLRNGYWEATGRDDRKFNIGTEGTGANHGVLHYNVNDLTAAGRSLAHAAIRIYELVLNVDFVSTVSTGDEVDIFFYDGQPDAYTDTFRHFWAPNSIDFANINISTDWLATYGTTVGSYSFSTYLHEIGHALGLGHGGPYNETVNFVTSTADPNYGNNSNIYLNDSWQRSIMSYLSPAANTTVNANFDDLVSPMVADWIALVGMYGMSPTAFTGSTTWGFNTNITVATSSVFANLASHADEHGFTIVDGGGTDTVDFSGYSAPQKIDLTPESFSDIGGRDGNMVIARGTIIERAIGGAGHDTITGNTAFNQLIGNAGNDVLDGMAGNDTLYGRTGNDTLYGGTGNDTLEGESGDDILGGEDGNDVLRPGAGNDAAIGGAGNDRIDDFVSSGTGGNDLFLGDIGNDTLYGWSGNDSLYGDDHDDWLYGEADNDRLYGGAGNDALSGGAGSDTLRGGAGRDVLAGGADAASGTIRGDVFDFDLVSDSPLGANCDLLQGIGGLAFDLPGTGNGDRVDVAGIDADTTPSASGNQTFRWGESTNDPIVPDIKGKGYLWLETEGTNTCVLANVNDIAGADFKLVILDAATLESAYTAADFIL